ncbi:transposase [Methylibium sp.]|uniref:transposase n=1 Tax=Methylibium sp. TaxID=2067992 RepID=UPI003D1414CC
MARLPRLIVPALPHLVSQRAQHGQVMVHDDVDRRSLMQLLREAASQHRVAVHAYSVLDGRFDLVATPERANGLSLVMQSVARRHASAFNRRHGRTGGLWEGRFRAAVIEPESWLLPCMVYVEQLGREAHAGTQTLVCSSEAPHRGRGADPLLVHPGAYWALGNTPFEREMAYGELLEHPLLIRQVQVIEAALRGGWALGSVAFATQLTSAGARPAAPRPRGRPPKSKAHHY